MQVIIIKTRTKKPGYKMKIITTAIMRKGRIAADLTQDIEFTEDKENGFSIYTR